MNKQNLKTAAPMPKEEKTIQNPMKFYTYLVCISGLATYPEHTRMFRHKDLMLTKIKEAIGLTDKTVKQYLFQLEQENLVQYQGKIKYLTEQEEEEIEKKIETIQSEKVKQRKRKEFIGAALWKKRNKEEKNGIYYIPRPNQWTPVPEQTLQKLNEDFECSELELKLYLLCCSYRDMCVFRGESFKAITFEKIKESLSIKTLNGDCNRDIRRALMFLKAIGLIEYNEKIIANRKGGRIPSFILREVNYYIDYEIEEIGEENIADIDWKEIIQRVQNFEEQA